MNSKFRLYLGVLMAIFFMTQMIAPGFQESDQNFQMAAPLGWDMEKLETFFEMGVRQIQLVGGRWNYLIDSCWEKTNTGLSLYGYEVIDAYNDLGIIVDLSHIGEKSSLDVIRASQDPVIFSHSGCYELCPHPRNVSDRNIKTMAEKGGVFCVFKQVVG